MLWRLMFRELLFSLQGRQMFRQIDLQELSSDGTQRIKKKQNVFVYECIFMMLRQSMNENYFLYMRKIQPLKMFGRTLAQWVR